MAYTLTDDDLVAVAPAPEPADPAATGRKVTLSQESLDAIDRFVSDCPPLTQAQRDRLFVLMNPPMVSGR